MLCKLVQREATLLCTELWYTGKLPQALQQGRTWAKKYICRQGPYRRAEIRPKAPRKGAFRDRVHFWKRKQL